MTRSRLNQGREAGLTQRPSGHVAYGVRRVRIGRQAATPRNVRDVGSRFCQLAKGITIKRLDRYDRDEGAWQEVLVEDKTAGPAEIAASRIDVGDWFRSLPERDCRIARTLATGETVSTIAAMGFVPLTGVPIEREPQVVDWDDLDARRVSVLPQRQRPELAAV